MGLVQADRCPYKKRQLGHGGTPMHGHREGTAICTSRREASGGTRPADTLSLAFQSQRGGGGGRSHLCYPPSPSGRPHCGSPGHSSRADPRARAPGLHLQGRPCPNPPGGGAPRPLAPQPHPSPQGQATCTQHSTVCDVRFACVVLWPLPVPSKAAHSPGVADVYLAKRVRGWGAGGSLQRSLKE